MRKSDASFETSWSTSKGMSSGRFPQGGNANLQYIEAIEQIASEAAF